MFIKQDKKCVQMHQLKTVNQVTFSKLSFSFDRDGLQMHAWIFIAKNVQLTQEFYLIMALVSFGQFRIGF